MPQKLKTLFLVSIPVVVAHGLEEYFAAFYRVDISYRYLFGGLSDFPSVFLTYQIVLWLLLILTYFLLSKTWIKYILILIGIIYIAELQHLIMTIISKQYYPGTITSVTLPIIGFLFLKELIKNLRQNHERYN